MKSEKARFVVFGELKLLVTTLAPPKVGCRLLFFTWNEIEKYLGIVPESDRDVIFLGVGDIEEGVLIRETNSTVLDTFAYFAVNFKKVRIALYARYDLAQFVMSVDSFGRSISGIPTQRRLC